MNTPPQASSSSPNRESKEQESTSRISNFLQRTTNKVSSAMTSSDNNPTSSSTTTPAVSKAEELAHRSMITTASTPQWLWANQHCCTYIRLILHLLLSYDYATAFDLSQTFSGCGANLYRKRKSEWIDMLGSEEAGDAIFTILCGEREKKDAVPKELLGDVKRMVPFEDIVEGVNARTENIRNQETEREVERLEDVFEKREKGLADERKGWELERRRLEESVAVLERTMAAKNRELLEKKGEREKLSIERRRWEVERRRLEGTVWNLGGGGMNELKGMGRKEER